MQKAAMYPEICLNCPIEGDETGEHQGYSIELFFVCGQDESSGESGIYYKRIEIVHFLSMVSVIASG